MQLTPFQKELTKTIAGGGACHIEKFFEVHCNFTRKKQPGDTFESYDGRQIRPLAGSEVCIVPDTYQEVGRLKDFISLWHKLERAHLVIIVPYHKGPILGIVPYLVEILHVDEFRLG
jgi:hypothetical protein